MNEMAVYESQISLADKLSKSVMCPHKRAEDALFAIMTGEAVGIPPAVALQNIFNINGTSCMRADMMLALVKRHPQYAGCEIKYGADRVEVSLHRKVISGNTDSVTVSFGAEEALRAKLNTKDIYVKYPERMYKARAIGYACRDLFPDAIWGLITYEEAIDTDPTERIELRYENLFTKCRDMLETKEMDEDAFHFYKESIDAADASQDMYSIETIWKKMSRLPDRIVISQDAVVIDANSNAIEEKLSKLPDLPADTTDYKAVDKLKEDIASVLTFLIDNKIGDYHVTPKRNASIKKHLHTETVRECKDANLLSTYLDYLTAQKPKTLDELKAEAMNMLDGLSTEDQEQYKAVINDCSTIEEITKTMSGITATKEAK